MRRAAPSALRLRFSGQWAQVVVLETYDAVQLN